MKLSQFNSSAAENAGRDLHLKVKTDDGYVLAYADHDADEPKKPLIITLMGLNSDVGEKLQLDAVREARTLAEKEKRSGRNKGDLNIDLQAEKEKLSRKLAKLTVGWKNIPTDDGDGELKFSEEEAYKVYLTYGDIRKQVSNFVGDELNFINS